MKQYLDLLNHILENGVSKEDRTGTGTISTFGYQMRFDLQEGFPAVTTKKLHLKSIIHELLWFLKGDTNVKYLQDNGVRIWNEWADENGELGKVYGYQWRSWEVPQNFKWYEFWKWGKKPKTIDQISNVINEIKNNPNSRRHLVVAFNPGQLNQMKLPPCHAFFQFYIADGKLSCQLYQRSGDSFLGIPYNIASYALLTYMMAQVCDLEAGEFIHTIGDAHIYNNHIDQVNLQLTRDPKPLPTIKLNPDIKNIFDFKYEDIEIVNYEAHPHIKGKVSV